MGWVDPHKELVAKLEPLFTRLAKRIEDFHYSSDGSERSWTIHFQDRNGKWLALKIAHWNGAYYFGCWGRGIFHNFWQWTLKVGESCEETENCRGADFPDPKPETLEDALKWLDCVEKDWAGVYRRVSREWPYARRSGRISRAILHRYVPDFPRIDRLAGEENAREFCELVDSGYYPRDYFDVSRHQKFFREKMTAREYLDLCGIGLEATVDAERDETKPMTGALYYKLNSYNGSCGTILKIDPDSAEEFRKWVRHEQPYGSHDGGHEWWIGPGRIHLFASMERFEGREADAHLLRLTSSFAWTAYNVVRMAMAYYRRGIHVAVGEAREIRNALQGEDDVAIVSERGDTRYAGHHGAYESIHLDVIGRRFVNVKDFINWAPQPILRPKNS